MWIVGYMTKPPSEATPYRYPHLNTNGLAQVSDRTHAKWRRLMTRD